MRLQALNQQCVDTLKTAYRPYTVRNYHSKLTGYLRFCEFYNLCPFSALEWQLIQFARYLGNGVTSFDTVKGYLSVIKRAHEIGDFTFPVKVELLKLEMRAIRFELAGPVKKATPITLEMLVDIVQHVKFDLPVELVCYVALVVGFCLFLRRSNLAPDTQKGFNSKEQLTRGDIFQFGNILVADIRWHKSLQYRQRDLYLPLILAKNKVVCPAFWLKVLLHKWVVDKNLPLFGYPQQGSWIPITTELLAKKLQGWIRATGREEESFTLHGL